MALKRKNLTKTERFLNRKNINDILNRENIILSCEDILELDKFFLKYSFSEVNTDKTNIVLLILKYGKTNIADWYEKAINSKRQTKEYYEIIGGSELLKIKKEKYSQHANNNFPNNIKYWINRGYSLEEAHLKVKEIQSDRANRAAKTFERSRSHRCVEYWTNKGFNIEEAKYKISKLQIRDLSYFEGKYGQDEGLLRRNNKIANWQKSLKDKSLEEIKNINQRKGKTFEELIELHGLDKAIEIIRSRTVHINKASNSSKKFFEKLDEYLGEKSKDSITAYKGHEWFIRLDTGLIFVDYRLKNKIIEYHGDIWHANPKIFKSEDIVPVLKCPALEIWNKDKLRLEKLTKLGYNVKVIWESDLTPHFDTIIHECLTFLGEEINDEPNFNKSTDTKGI